MNIKDKHSLDIPFSEISLFEGNKGKTSAFQILKGIQLNNQIHKNPALLICVEGKVIFQDEKGMNETLIPGDFINIEPLLIHRVRGLSNSQLLVIQ